MLLFFIIIQVFIDILMFFITCQLYKMIKEIDNYYDKK